MKHYVIVLLIQNLLLTTTTMKKLFFICGLSLFTTLSYSQVTPNPQTFEDSLNLAKQMIDQMSDFEIIKQRERFVYLNRTQPSRINKEVLIYIEDKFKKIKR